MKRWLRTSRMLLCGAILILGAAGCGGKEAPREKGAAPIVIGVPTALGSIEGADALRAVQMAVEEINARGGVPVKGEKRPFQFSPGSPTPVPGPSGGREG